MDAARNAISSFVNRGGKETTDVDETVNPAVTREQIKPHQHEETTQAIDREVHRDHYHTTVQPVAAKEVLPETHTHQQLPTQEREFHHGDGRGIEQAVAREQGAFTDSSVVQDTTHSSSRVADVAGEHVHHHVHETVQPVVHKETIQPTVVHTTIPIHETHHAPSEHHGLSTLPTKTIDEFSGAGGALSSSGSARQEHYDGHPRPYNPELQVERPPVDKHPEQHTGTHDLKKTGHNEILRGSENDTGYYGTPTGGGVGTTSSTTGGYGNDGLGSGLTGRGTDTSGSINPLSSRSGADSGISNIGSGIGHDHRSGSGIGGTNTSSTLGAVGGTNTHTPGDRSEAHHTSTNTGIGGYDTSNAHSSHGTGLTSDDRDTSRGLGGDHSTSTARHGTSTHHDPTEVQSPSQGVDPATVDSKSSGSKLTGTGVDGSHSALFGLTPDGHKSKETSSITTAPVPVAKGDGDRNTGSSATGSSGVAQQLRDPKVNEPGHGGTSLNHPGDGKPGAGGFSALGGGEQGLGEVRPGQHGGESRLKDKVDPTTDSDRDGKRGVLD